MCSVLVLAAGLAACGGGKGSTGRSGAEAKTTTTGPAALGAGGDQNGVPTTLKPGATASGGTAKPGKTTATTGRQRRPGVPAPGRYLYATGPKNEDVRALDFYEGEGQTGNDVIQLETWTDKSTIIRSVDIFRLDAKIVDYEQKATPDQNGQPHPGPLCDWAPDIMDVRLPLTVGQTWSTKTSCPQGGDPPRERTVEAKATSTDTVTVAGEALPVVVIERKVVDVQRLPIGPFTTTTTTTEFYSPNLALVLRVTGTVEQKIVAKATTTAFRMDIKSVHPSPLPS
ncbi:MAG TPA: hypothetical protein VGO92_06290 [Acidimicrobiales bacterium]|nr:hypothetical protein [Acidimicrobiales bacterium]